MPGDAGIRAAGISGSRQIPAWPLPSSRASPLLVYPSVRACLPPSDQEGRVSIYLRRGIDAC